MIKTLRAVLLAATALCAISLSPGRSHAGLTGLVGPNSDERSLRQLGAEADLSLDVNPPDSRSASVGLDFEIAEGSNQGPESWWYINLVGVLVIDRAMDPQGEVFLSAGVNGQDVASIKFDLSQQEIVNWRSVGFDGQRDFTTYGRRVPFDFRNLLTTQSVRAGPSKISVDVAAEGSGFSAVVMLDTSLSGLEVGDDTPHDLSLSFGDSSSVGRDITIPVEVINTDPSPARAVVVTVIRDECQCEIVHPDGELALGDIPSSLAFELRVRSDGIDPGRLTVIAEGAERNDFAMAELALRAVPDSSSPWWRTRTTLAVTAVCLGIVLLGSRSARAGHPKGGSNYD